MSAVQHFANQVPSAFVLRQSPGQMENVCLNLELGPKTQSQQKGIACMCCMAGAKSVDKSVSDCSFACCHCINNKLHDV